MHLRVMPLSLASVPPGEIRVILSRGLEVEHEIFCMKTRDLGGSVMQIVSHLGEVASRPPQLCSHAAQQMWSAALQSEEQRKHFERGGSKLYTTSAAPDRAVQATAVAWPCRRSPARWGDKQRWALCLRGVKPCVAAQQQLYADVSCVQHKA